VELLLDTNGSSQGRGGAISNPPVTNVSHLYRAKAFPSTNVMPFVPGLAFHWYKHEASSPSVSISSVILHRLLSPSSLSFSFTSLRLYPLHLLTFLLVLQVRGPTGAATVAEVGAGAPGARAGGAAGSPASPVREPPAPDLEEARLPGRGGAGQAARRHRWSLLVNRFVMCGSFMWCVVWFVFC
jgi:hypothetical protein